VTAEGGRSTETGGQTTGGAGGAVGSCDTGPGTGGVNDAGASSGCDLEVARQALAALGIATVGDARTGSITLPPMLTDAQWSVKNEVCSEGGYDLSPIAGTTACLVSQVTTEKCQSNPARAYVLMSNGIVQCVFKALCPGSRIAPGVYSTVDPLCVP
jgi:hypothetical protein